MPTTYKRLNAVVPTTAGTGNAKVLYSVAGTVTNAVVSTISVCNKTSIAQTYRLCVNSSNSNSVFEDTGYIAYDSTVPANDTVFITTGITLTTAVPHLLCSASSLSVSFGAFGAELS